MEEIYGEHNLTSDSEPEEMLMVERKKVVEWYSSLLKEHKIYAKGTTDRIRLGAKLTMIEELFGDKCLPDKELEHGLEQTVQESVQVEPKPKFKVGDKVRVLEIAELVDNRGRVATIVKQGECCKGYGWVLDISKSVFLESELEPYTEESHNLSQNIVNCDKSEDNQLKDNMKEKEPCTLTISLALSGNDDGSFYNERFNIPFNSVEEVMDAAWDLKKYLQDKYRKR